MRQADVLHTMHHNCSNVSQPARRYIRVFLATIINQQTITMSEEKKTRVRTKPLEQQTTPELLKLQEQIKTILDARATALKAELQLIGE